MKTFFIVMVCVFIACMPQPSYSGSWLEFGSTAIDLGPSVKMVPGIDDAFSNQIKSVEFNKFYHIGGYDAPVAQSDVRLFWDDNALYLVFKCENPYPNKYLKPRDDKMALYLNLNNEKDKYYEFSTNLKNVTVAKYYLKSDSFKVLTIPGAESRFENDKWLGKITVPWQVIGGRPENIFGILIIRHRQQNDPAQGAELSSPVALDFYNPTKTGMYLETSFGKTASVVQSGTDMLTRLPSGILHWQRPAITIMPDEKECNELYKTQVNSKSPTGKENLAERINYIQRCEDMLMLEGCIFTASGGVWPVPMKYMPWEARNEINIALAKNDFSEAYRIVDILLTQFDAILKYWFVDGSPGNILHKNWKMLEKIINVQRNKNEIKIDALAAGESVSLTLTLPQTGGIRIRSSNTGLFNPVDIPFDKTELLKNEIIIYGKGVIVSVTKGEDWSVTLKDSLKGAIIWQIKKGDLAFYMEGNKVTGVDMSGDLSEDEAVYGFGERFDKLNQRNNIINLRVYDCNDPLINGVFFNGGYKIVPLVHSSKGYSMYFNTSYLLRADLGKQTKNRYRYTTHGPVFDVYVWNQPPLEVIERFSELTGKPMLPPKWVFEPWMGGTPYSTAHLISMAEKFVSLDIPHSAIYTEGGVADDPLLYKKLAPFNLRPLAWECNFSINPKKAKEFMSIPGEEFPYVRGENGKILNYQWDIWFMISWFNPSIDFFDPKAMDLLRAYWKNRFDMGICGSMVDFGELITDDARINGRKGDEMHNMYCLQYHKVYNSLFEERRGKDFVLFARSGFSGDQANICQFAGDHQSNFYGLIAAMKGLINISTACFSNYGPDLGGYVGFADEEIYDRWVEWGAFCPIMRLHGTQLREPWAYSDSSTAIYKKYAWFRENILDYIYSSAVNANHTGIPIVREIQLTYPGENILMNCDDEYLFGPSLLVAPVHSEGESRQVRFPSGNWVNLWTNKSVKGVSVQNVDVPLNSIAAYLKEGAIIPAHLAGSLNWGESMTNNKVAVMIVTPPSKSGIFDCWEDSIHNSTVINEPVQGGFSVTIKNRPATHYMIICGSVEKISTIKINDEQVPELKGDQRLAEPPGWYEDHAGRIIVRLPCDRLQKITILFNQE